MTLQEKLTNKVEAGNNEVYKELHDELFEALMSIDIDNHDEGVFINTVSGKEFVTVYPKELTNNGKLKNVLSKIEKYTSAIGRSGFSEYLRDTFESTTIESNKVYIMDCKRSFRNDIGDSYKFALFVSDDL